MRERSAYRILDNVKTDVKGKGLTNQNCIREEVKNRLKSGNACCNSVQNLLSSSSLSKNVNMQNCNLAGCFVWV